MSRARFLALMLVIVSACGGPTNTTLPPATAIGSSPANASPGATPSPAGPGDPAFDAIKADAVTHSGEPTDLADDRAQLLDHMGIRAALGSNADGILALSSATEGAVRAQQTRPTARAGVVDAAFLKFSSPYTEFRELIGAAVAEVGRPGAQSYHQDFGTQSNTQSAAGRSSTTQQHTVLDISFQGSVATVDVVRDITNTVTDIASGAALLSETAKHHIVGQLDACPNRTGIAPASLVVSREADATTTAGPDGAVASHATGSEKRSSTFEGTVDDTATLGTVTQAYTHEESFKRTASTEAGDVSSEGQFTFGATGISDGVPSTGVSTGANIGDWAGAQTSGTQSGDVTSEMFHPMDTNAGSDFATMNDAYLEAQKVWRDSRCVIVTAPPWVVKSDYDTTAHPTHTEEIDKGSTTVFQVALDHRFGQTVAAKILTELDGTQSLDPQAVPTPPGTLTYVAPDEDGKDARAILTSTSRQGIGRLLLTFHTGTKKLKVSISGTLTTSGLGVSYRTTFSVSGLILGKQPDGTYRGTGPINAKMFINGDVPCPHPFSETGQLVLRATRPPRAIANEGQPNEVVDESLPRQWKLAYDLGTRAVTSGSCLGLSLGQFLQLGPDGFTGPFMLVLFGQTKDGSPDVITIAPDGSTVNVKRTTAIGPSTSKIDATVKAEVISESKP